MGRKSEDGWILKQHPLKQGLKRSMGSIDLDELLHFKATSIKTRIETPPLDATQPALYILKQHPLKQGLKRLYIGT